MRYRRPKPSIVLGTVAAVVVASPVAILVGGSAPNFAVDPSDAPTAQSVTPTTINQVSLNDVPTLVLNLVKSGLADVGVTLPPIDISGIDLPDIPLQIPSGVIPTELLPSTTAPATTAPATTVPESPAPSGAPAAPGTPEGALVKEISQDKPFSMVGLTWEGLADTTAYIRAKQADGSWGPWLSADKIDGVSGKDPNTQGTDPIWIGNANVIQIAVTNDGIAEPGGPADSPAATSSGTESTGAETPQTTSTFTTPPVPQRTGTSIPTSTVAPGEIVPRVFTPKQEPLLTTTGAPQQDLVQALSSISAALISPGTTEPPAPGEAPAENVAPVAPPAPAPAPIGTPQVISRAQWGADESMRCAEPTYDAALKETIVHHTAGSNDYTPEQSAEIVRGIYAYHAQTLGWCDIGYNVLVDKYGQTFEGTAGGLDRFVQGVHAGGFNQDTMGLAMMGNLNEVQPTPEMINAAGTFLGWKLRLAGLDPNGQGSVVSIGFPGGLYAAGETATLPIISGHRDFYSTDCPGQFGYDALPQIRAIAAGNGQLPTANPQVLSTTDTGVIAQQWMATGGPTGELGNATTVEQTTPDGTAKYVDFENGKIYWSEATGAQVIQGAIEKAWAALGFETGSLGLPTSGETAGPEGISQAFQGGTLVFNLITGIVEVLRTYIDEFTNSYNEQRDLATTAPPA